MYISVQEVSCGALGLVLRLTAWDNLLDTNLCCCCCCFEGEETSHKQVISSLKVAKCLLFSLFLNGDFKDFFFCIAFQIRTWILSCFDQTSLICVLYISIITIVANLLIILHKRSCKHTLKWCNMTNIDLHYL